MRQRNQALVDAMEIRGFDVKDLAREMGVTLPAVYNWIRGGRPRAAQRAKLTKLLEIDVVESAKAQDKREKADAMRLVFLQRAAEKQARAHDLQQAQAVQLKANGTEHAVAPEQGNRIRLEPAGDKAITVRVSGDGLLVEVKVRRGTAQEVLSVLGFTTSG